MPTQKFLQGIVSSLYGNGIGLSNTSITLSYLRYKDGTEVVAADLGDLNYATLDTGVNQEIISFTDDITKNANGTTTLNVVVRGLRPKSPYTADSSLRRPHAVGCRFVMSNNPQLYQDLASVENDETIGGKYTFPGGGDANAPVSGTVYSEPTDDLEYVSKKYADDLAIAGSPKATEAVYGITKLSVAAVSPTDPIAVGDNDTRVSPVSLSTLTSGQVEALAGTSGTPGTANKYVTNNDTTSTPTADAVVRAQANSRIASGWIDNVILFGDGSDGDVVISGNTTLTRDMFYDDLTVNVGIILNPAGYRIFVKGTLTNNGSILRTGNSGSVGAAGTQGNSNAAGGAGGTKLAGVTVADGVAGGAGGAGGKGYYYSGSPQSPTAGAVAVTSNSTASIGVNGTSGAAGGAGGNGDLTPTTGEGQAGGVTGTGGTATTPTTPLYYILGAIQQYQVTAGTITQYLSSSQSAGGSGGGGAGGDNPNGQDAGAGGGGGGAGGSGGVIAIYANTIVNSATGIIAALGGAGANGGLGGTTSDDSGRVLGGGGGGAGGSGGSGGVIVILTQSYTNLGTVSVAGGAGGTGAAGGTGKNGGTNGATGSNGQTGTTGIIYLFQL